MAESIEAEALETLAALNEHMKGAYQALFRLTEGHLSPTLDESELDVARGLIDDVLTRRQIARALELHVHGRLKR